jgi:hypothetical protein
MWRRTGSGSGAAGSSAAGRCGVVRRWLTRRVARSASVRPESGVAAADASRRTGAARPGGIAALAAGLTAAATANARPGFSGRRGVYFAPDRNFAGFYHFGGGVLLLRPRARRRHAVR